MPLMNVCVPCYWRKKCTAARFRRIGKLLIANRGEIACRVIRTARRMGISPIAVYSEADSNALHVKLADNAYCIGPAAVDQSYLNQQSILEAAERAGVDAIHPGYGFLSENAEFACECTRRGFTWVGPSSVVMLTMGSKDQAKNIMSKIGMPVIPGYQGEDQTVERLKAEATSLGYPIMLKATHGGGGKGMRQVTSEADFDTALKSAREEAIKSFGNDRMILEKYIAFPRHIEVQIFGDQYGNYVHLYERDCSIQRRHQKIIEEAPAPAISEATRRNLGKAAVRIATAVGYVGAGTVEFLVDNEKRSYFLEMNTRLQVEHPVTEMITGIDLVEWQLRIASGEQLPIRDQGEIQIHGHSFEARLYAENPWENFTPSPGLLSYLNADLLQGRSDIRLEIGMRESDQMSLHYDPLIAKLIVWDDDRTVALNKLHDALAEIRLAGVSTNLPFLRTLCTSEELVRSTAVSTQFVGENQKRLLHVLQTKNWLQLGASWVAASLHLLRRSSAANGPFDVVDGFRVNMPSAMEKLSIMHGNDVLEATLQRQSNSNSLLTTVGSRTYDLTIVDFNVSNSENKRLVTMQIEWQQQIHKATIVYCQEKAKIFSATLPAAEFEFSIRQPKWHEGSTCGEVSNDWNVVAPLPGVIEKTNVRQGELVKRGDVLVIMIAMKTEYSLKATTDSVVERITVQPGQYVAKGVTLVHLRQP